MPSLATDRNVRWSNYHLTTGTRNSPDLEPCVQVEELVRIYAGDIVAVDRIERFAATAATLRGYLARVQVALAMKQALNQLGDPPSPFPATMVGRGWSFSNLNGADHGKSREMQLMCDGLTGAVMLAADDLADESCAMAGSLALVGGGMRLRELSNWAAEHHGRALRTSGTHLGATIAGVFGTSSHGSRLGFGGIQNMVRGIHLVTGPEDSVWIERAGAPVLTADARNKLDPRASGGVRAIANDARFEDALVHLGCMGIVNCVALELVPDVPYDALRRVQAVDESWLDHVAAGNWQAIAGTCGEDRMPQFYEATLDPHDWNGPSALHTFYFDVAAAGAAGDPGPGQSPKLTAGDAVAQFGEAFSLVKSVEQAAEMLKQLPEIDKFLDADRNELDWGALPARMQVFDPSTTANSVYGYYAEKGGFAAASPWQLGKTWRELHGDEITAGQPGSLYNASYAIRRSDVKTAIPAICAAVAELPQSFVFTLRFVSNPAGTLAFTRFQETAIIEIDGLSPWFCRRGLRDLSRGSPSYYPDRKMLKYLEFTLPQGARRVASALESAGIDYSNHWAKRSFLDHAKIARDFGPAADPARPIARWRATRDAVLGNPLGKAVFWNWAVVNLGLLDRPGMPDRPD